MNTAVEILEFSRDLIKAGWTRGTWAEDRYEAPVDVGDPNACCFCAFGAFMRAKHVLKPKFDEWPKAKDALRASLPTEWCGSIIRFNDAQHSEEPVVDLFDRAIESLKEKV